MREVIQKLEDIELDLIEVHRDMVRLQQNGFAERVSELKDELYGLILDLEDEAFYSLTTDLEDKS